MIHLVIYLPIVLIGIVLYFYMCAFISFTKQEIKEQKKLKTESNSENNTEKLVSFEKFKENKK